MRPAVPFPDLRFDGIAWGIIAAAFLLGSIPFGVLLAKARGVDLKKVGSGNIGATNAARALGKKAGALVLLLDAVKAWLPTAYALWHGQPPAVAATAGFAAFAGHIYSPWLRFKGGKGVACALGAFLALAPLATATALAVSVVVMALTRIGSLGSLAGALAILPVLLLRHEPRAYVILAALMLILIFWRHRDNLRRIVRGEENKI
jgi:glycerol-3-phosphate acyltransferase PlsY